MNAKHLKYWIPVVIWMALIFWMSTDTFSSKNTSLIIEPLLRFLMPELSTEKISAVHGVIRKLGHLTEYFILGVLIFRAFRVGSSGPVILRLTIYTILLLVFYAITDEVHQTFVSARTASVLDVCIDATGGFLGQLSVAFWRSRSGK